MSKLKTAEYCIPRIWAQECLKEDIRKNEVVQRRRKKIQKARGKHSGI